MDKIILLTFRIRNILLCIASFTTGASCKKAETCDFRSFTASKERCLSTEALINYYNILRIRLVLRKWTGLWAEAIFEPIVDGKKLRRYQNIKIDFGAY